MHFESDHLYHIFNRGNNSQTIFYNRENSLFFLQKIKQYILPYADILAWIWCQIIFTWWYMWILLLLMSMIKVILILSLRVRVWVSRLPNSALSTMPLESCFEPIPEPFKNKNSWLGLYFRSIQKPFACPNLRKLIFRGFMKIMNFRIINSMIR